MSNSPVVPAKHGKVGKTPRPAVFVGSSVEALDVAYAIQENLQHDAEVTVWPQGVVELSDTAVKSLLKVLRQSDFGVFVFSPDDQLRLRKKTYSAVRDNVVFELGLFTASLGSERTFLVAPEDAQNLRIPTDLTGVTPGKYDSKRRDRNLIAALGPFCNQVRRALRRKGALRVLPAKKPPKSSSLKGVTIHSAMYGVREHRIDVKAKLLAELRRSGSAYIGNQLGGDPTPNSPKDLLLDFTVQGQRQQVSIPEGNTLGFPK